jgi:SPP1 family predicted phage head-tail adaptor
MNTNILKYRIMLQSPVVTANPYGSKQVVNYVNYLEILAGMEVIGGNKAIQNFELFTSQILQFKIRYRQDFDCTFRIKFEDKFYSILNIKPQGWKDSLVITAELQQT